MRWARRNSDRAVRAFARGGNFVIRLTIAAVGKCDGIYRGAAEEYIKRISRFAKAEIIEVRERGPGGSAIDRERAKETESAELFARAKGVIVALDKDGAELTSEAFADFLGRNAADGASAFTFLIGGSDGLSREAVSKADMVLSFGKMTLPHQLARLALAEQLYRAMTILNGVTYHK